MTRLSPNAESALDTLREKHIAYTIAKATIENQLKQELANRLATIRHDRDMALRLASEAGVPKTQLGKAIGTTNYRTVQEIMALTEGVVGSVDVGETRVDVERSLEPGIFLVSVSALGEQKVSGKVLTYVDDDGSLIYNEGDAFVIPQLYRANLADNVIAKILELEKD
jgi:DNA-binding phage protein